MRSYTYYCISMSAVLNMAPVLELLLLAGAECVCKLGKETGGGEGILEMKRVEVRLWWY